MSIDLTGREIERITGRKKPSAQLRALGRMGIIAKRRADGSVLVSRRHFEDVMGGSNPCDIMPDFEALNGT